VCFWDCSCLAQRKAGSDRLILDGVHQIGFNPIVKVRATVSHSTKANFDEPWPLLFVCTHAKLGEVALAEPSVVSSLIGCEIYLLQVFLLLVITLEHSCNG
jgi:hypothetical protein